MPSLRDVINGRYSPFKHTGKAGEVRQATVEENAKEKKKK
jgi:hypothetical protein